MADEKDPYADYVQNPLSAGANTPVGVGPPPERGPFGYIRDTGIDLARGVFNTYVRDPIAAKTAINIGVPGADTKTDLEDLAAVEDVDYWLKRRKTPTGQHYDKYGATWGDNTATKIGELVTGLVPAIPVAFTGPAAIPLFGGMAYGQQQAMLHERLRDASPEELAKIPEYQQAIKEGKSDADARNELFIAAADPRKLENWAAVAPAVIGNMIGGGVGSIVLSKGTMRTVNDAVFGRVMKNLQGTGVVPFLQRRAIGTGEAAIGGGAQMGGGEWSRQMMEQGAGIQREPTDFGKVGEHTLEGAATFGPMGTLLGMHRRPPLPTRPRMPTPGEVREYGETIEPSGAPSGGPPRQPTGAEMMEYGVPPGYRMRDLDAHDRDMGYADDLGEDTASVAAAQASYNTRRRPTAEYGGMDEGPTPPPLPPRPRPAADMETSEFDTGVVGGRRRPDGSYETHPDPYDPQGLYGEPHRVPPTPGAPLPKNIGEREYGERSMTHAGITSPPLTDPWAKYGPRSRNKPYGPMGEPQGPPSFDAYGRPHAPWEQRPEGWWPGVDQREVSEGMPPYNVKGPEQLRLEAAERARLQEEARPPQQLPDEGTGIGERPLPPEFPEIERPGFPRGEEFGGEPTEGPIPYGDRNRLRQVIGGKSAQTRGAWAHQIERALQTDRELSLDKFPHMRAVLRKDADFIDMVLQSSPKGLVFELRRGIEQVPGVNPLTRGHVNAVNAVAQRMSPKAIQELVTKIESAGGKAVTWINLPESAREVLRKVSPEDHRAFIEALQRNPLEVARILEGREEVRTYRETAARDAADEAAGEAPTEQEAHAPVVRQTAEAETKGEVHPAQEFLGNRSLEELRQEAEEARYEEADRRLGRTGPEGPVIQGPARPARMNRPSAPLHEYGEEREVDMRKPFKRRGAAGKPRVGTDRDIGITRTGRFAPGTEYAMDRQMGRTRRMGVGPQTETGIAAGLRRVMDRIARNKRVREKEQLEAGEAAQEARAMQRQAGEPVTARGDTTITSGKDIPARPIDVTHEAREAPEREEQRESEGISRKRRIAELQMKLDQLKKKAERERVQDPVIEWTERELRRHIEDERRRRDTVIEGEAVYKNIVSKEMEGFYATHPTIVTRNEQLRRAAAARTRQQKQKAALTADDYRQREEVIESTLKGGQPELIAKIEEMLDPRNAFWEDRTPTGTREAGKEKEADKGARVLSGDEKIRLVEGARDVLELLQEQRKLTYDELIKSRDAINASGRRSQISWDVPKARGPYQWNNQLADLNRYTNALERMVGPKYLEDGKLAPITQQRINNLKTQTIRGALISHWLRNKLLAEGRVAEVDQMTREVQTESHSWLKSRAERLQRDIAAEEQATGSKRNTITKLEADLRNTQKQLDAIRVPPDATLNERHILQERRKDLTARVKELQTQLSVARTARTVDSAELRRNRSDLNRVNRILKEFDDIGGADYDPANYETMLVDSIDEVNDPLFRDLHSEMRKWVLDHAREYIDNVPREEEIQARRAEQRRTQTSPARQLVSPQRHASETREQQDRRMDAIQQRVDEIYDELDRPPLDPPMPEEGVNQRAYDEQMRARTKEMAADTERRDALRAELERLDNMARDLRVEMNPEVLNDDYSVGKVLDPTADMEDVRNLPQGSYVRRVTDFINRPVSGERGGGGGRPITQRRRHIELNLRPRPGSDGSRLLNHYLDVVNEVSGDVHIVAMSPEQLNIAKEKRGVDPTAPAFYDRRTHRILIDRDKLEGPEARGILMHEFSHPMTEVAIERFPKIAERLDMIRKHMRDLYYEMAKHKDYLGREWETDQYAHPQLRAKLRDSVQAFNNVHEFVAHLYGDGGKLAAAMYEVRTTPEMRAWYGPAKTSALLRKVDRPTTERAPMTPGEGQSARTVRRREAAVRAENERVTRGRDQETMLDRLLRTLKEGFNGVFWLASKKRLLNEATINSLDLFESVREGGRQRPTPADITRPMAKESSRVEWMTLNQRARSSLTRPSRIEVAKNPDMAALRNIIDESQYKAATVIRDPETKTIYAVSRDTTLHPELIRELGLYDRYHDIEQRTFGLVDGRVVETDTPVFGKPNRGGFGYEMDEEGASSRQMTTRETNRWLEKDHEEGTPRKMPPREITPEVREGWARGRPRGGREMIRELRKYFLTKDEEAILDTIEPLIKDVKIEHYPTSVMHKVFDAEAQYDPVRHIISLPHDYSTPLVIHEMLHAATARALMYRPQFRDAIQKIVDHLKEHPELQGYLERPLSRSDRNFLKDPHEFIAEFYSDPQLRKWLDTMKVPKELLKALQQHGQEHKSLFRQILDLIAHYLYRGSEHGSVRELSARMIDDVLAQQKRLPEMGLEEWRQLDAREQKMYDDPDLIGGWLPPHKAPIGHHLVRAGEVMKDASERFSEVSQTFGLDKLFLKAVSLSGLERMVSEGAKPTVKRIDQIMDRTHSMAQRLVDDPEGQGIARRMADLLRVNHRSYDKVQDYRYETNHWQVHGGDPWQKGRNKRAKGEQQHQAWRELRDQWNDMTDVERKLFNDTQDYYDRRHSAVLQHTLDPLIDAMGMLPKTASDGSPMPGGIKSRLMRYIIDGPESLSDRETRALTKYVPGFDADDTAMHAWFKAQVKNLRSHSAFKKLDVWSPSERRGNWVIEAFYNMDPIKGRGTQIMREGERPSGEFEFDTAAERDAFNQRAFADRRYSGMRHMGNEDVVYASDGRGGVLRDAEGKPVPLTEYRETTRRIGSELEPGYTEITSGRAHRVKPKDADGEGVVRYRSRFNPLLLEFHDKIHDANMRHRQLQQGEAEGYLRLTDVKAKRAHQHTYVDPMKLDRIHAEIARQIAGGVGRHIDKTQYEMLMRDLNEATIRTMASMSAKSTSLPRHFAQGSRKDMIRDFTEYHRKTSHTLAGLAHRTELAGAMDELGKYIQRNENSKVGMKDQNVYDSLFERVTNHPNSVVDPIWSQKLTTLLRLSYLDKLASPAFWGLQAIEPWTVSAPVLAGKYGIKAYGELARAMRDVQAARTMGVGFGEAWTTFRRGWRNPLEQSEYLPGRLRDNLAHDAEAVGLISHLEDHSIIDRNAGLEMHRELDPTRQGSVLDWADHWARQINSQIEGTNRAGVGLAAYRLARAAGESVEAAKEYARATVHETAGNYNAYASAPMFNHPILRPALQFKRYAARMTSLWARAFMNAGLAAVGKLPEGQRAEAYRQLAFMVGTAVTTSGYLGLPTEPIKAVLNLTQAFTGYNAADIERMLYENTKLGLGEHLGEFLAKGGFRAAGLGLGERTGYSSLWTYGNIGTKPSDWLEAIGRSAIGAPGSYVMDLANASGNIANGTVNLARGRYTEFKEQYLNAVEQLLPIKMAADTIGAVRRQIGGPSYRTPATGLTQGYQPTWFDTGAQMAGVQTARVQRMNDQRQAMKADFRRHDADWKRLVAAYSYAESSGQRATIVKQMQQFNEQWPEMKPKNISDLMKARRRHEAREEADPSLLGLTLTRQQKTLLPRYAVYGNQ